jgi:hypothetical protein
MTDLERVWLAAIIDGEGCVHVRNDGYLALIVSNTNEALVRRVLDITGVGAMHRRSPLGNRRARWDWKVAGTKAKLVLCQVLPFLIVKRPHAEFAIRIPYYHNRDARGRNCPLTDEQLRKRQVVVATAHALNARGALTGEFYAR